MTSHYDIALLQLNVLDSLMAYREAGSRADPVALFYAGTDHVPGTLKAAGWPKTGHNARWMSLPGGP
jgi:hypothetical protein